jgi:hypothetical protein
VSLPLTLTKCQIVEQLSQRPTGTYKGKGGNRLRKGNNCTYNIRE